MNQKHVALGFIVLLLLLTVGVILHAQNTPDACYEGSFGTSITEEADALLTGASVSLTEISINMQNNLTRHEQMDGHCYVGEIGIIYGTLPNRVFAVFQSWDERYGYLRIMTEDQYYPDPFEANSVGWTIARDQ